MGKLSAEKCADRRKFGARVHPRKMIDNNNGGEAGNFFFRRPRRMLGRYNTYLRAPVAPVGQQVRRAGRLCARRSAAADYTMSKPISK